jgi:hypothetical protein
MKKALALLLAMLVIGTVFAGPVHINGPGISETLTGYTFEIGSSVSVDGPLFIDRRPLNDVQAVLHVIPDSRKFIGGISRPQEVISLRGSCKPRDFKTLLI